MHVIPLNGNPSVLELSSGDLECLLWSMSSERHGLYRSSQNQEEKCISYPIYECKRAWTNQLACLGLDRLEA
jgi:hypothetical protein